MTPDEIDQVAATIWTWEQAVLYLSPYLGERPYETVTPAEWFTWAAGILASRAEHAAELRALLERIPMSERQIEAAKAVLG